MTSRTPMADLLKGIAVVLMIQVHILENFASNSIFNSHGGKLSLFLGGPPVAPVFMIMLGYFLADSKKTTQQLINRGIQIFAAGIFLNIALNANLLIGINNGRFNIDPFPYLFGVDILQFAGLSILVIVGIRKILEKSLPITLISIVIVIVISQLLNASLPNSNTGKYITAYVYGSTDWSYFPLFPWLAYPLTGIAFHHINQRNNLKVLYTKNDKLLIAGILLLFLSFTFDYGLNISSNLLSYYHHGILFFIWVIAFVMGHAFFVNEINHYLGNTIVFKLIRWMGKNVTIIYIIQWIIIGNIST
ncbi:MAG: putative membrane protein, partial [Chitinophagaceae bacterium]